MRVLWGSALATLEPGHQDTFDNYDNDQRAPLLFISGRDDHLMPPSVQRSNAKHYALEWAVSHAREGNAASTTRRSMTTGRYAPSRTGKM